MPFVIQITEASAEKIKRKVLSLIIPFFNDFLYINLYDIVMELLRVCRAHCYLFLILVVVSQRRLNNILEKLQNSIKQIWTEFFHINSL